MDTPSPAGHYLGCAHEPITKTVAGMVVRGIRYDMSQYLRTAVDQYKAVVKKTTGVTPVMKAVHTPFLPDDQTKSFQGAPRRPLPGHTICPHCSNEHQLDGGRLVATAGLPDAATNESENLFPTKKKKKARKPLAAHEYGELSAVASSVLMTILYAARMARFDLLRAVAKLACDTTRWEPHHDRQLFQRM